MKLKFDSQIAALNDKMEFNSKRVIHIIIRILLSSPENQMEEFEFQENNQILNKKFDSLNDDLYDSLIEYLNNQQVNEYTEYIEHLSEQGINFYHLFTEEYPNSLWRLDDQPLGLYVDGQSDVFHPSIAIVGSRDTSETRIDATREIARQLAGNGYTITSGLALGTDTAAHQGALDVNGNTIAILPGDIESIVPKSNRSLASEIKSNGALVSEISSFVTMHNGRYIERNRLTSGMSNAIVVTGASRKGGTMIQAEIASDQEIPRFYYKPGIDDGLSPRKLDDLGFKPFQSTSDLIQLIEQREDHFETLTTRDSTLFEF